MAEKKKKKVTIVVPCYNEEGNIELLFQKVRENFQKLPFTFEVLFVDDGSSDDTLQIIESLSLKNKEVRYISFSKNFGHQKALKAGLDHAKGDCVISMDADLQHPPGMIPALLKKWEEGFDIVYTKRIDDEKVSLFKRFTANFFYSVINRLSGLNIDKGAADFRLLDRVVVDVIKSINEANLFIRGMIPWLGFKQFGIEYVVEKRHSGKTKYTFRKMFSFALEGVTSFSITPLHLSTAIGLFFCLIAFGYMLHALYIYWTSGKQYQGWVSIIFSIYLMGGIQLLILGIFGEYIGKMFIESKKRPNYVIRRKKL